MSFDLDLDQYEAVTVKLKGESHRVRLPSTKEQVSLESAVTKATDSDDAEAIMSLLQEHFVSLGLEKDLVSNLNFVQLQKLGKLLSGVDSGK